MFLAFLKQYIYIARNVELISRVASIEIDQQFSFYINYYRRLNQKLAGHSPKNFIWNHVVIIR
jgi:hypothetical protein